MHKAIVSSLISSQNETPLKRKSPRISLNTPTQKNTEFLATSSGVTGEDLWISHFSISFLFKASGHKLLKD